MYDVVIIGGGTSAATYLATKLGDLKDKKVLMLDNKGGLWKQFNEKGAEHKLGQPAHLLQLPSNEKFEFKNIFNRQDKTNLDAFMSVADYQKSLSQLLSQTKRKIANFQEHAGIATKISKSETGAYAIETDSGKAIETKSVVVASGIGQQKEKDNSKNTQGINGIDYLTNPEYQKPNGTILVESGGATSAWVASQAKELGNKVIWISRSGFSKSDLPGDRNFDVLNDKEILKYDNAKILSTDRTEDGKINVKVVDSKAKDNPKVLFNQAIDQIIYSMGSDKKENNKLFSEEIFNGLEPIYDTDSKLDSYPSSNTPEELRAPILGMQSQDGTLKIMPATITNLEPNENISPNLSTLPKNAQVPDGIAAAVNNISRMNNYIIDTSKVPASRVYSNEQDKVISQEIDNINLNTASASQIQAWLQFNLFLGKAENFNLAFETIVKARQNSVEGYSEKEYKQMVLETIINKNPATLEFETEDKEQIFEKYKKRAAQLSKLNTSNDETTTQSSSQQDQNLFYIQEKRLNQNSVTPEIKMSA